MSKIAFATALYFADALIALLDDNGYDTRAVSGADNYILVNTDKLTAKDSATDKARPSYNPATQWSAIATIVSGTNTAAATPIVAAAAPVVAASLVSAPTASATTPVATAFDSRGAQILVGDTVLMTNTSKTKRQFRLDTSRRYTVNLITASGKIGFAEVPNDQFLPKRATKVASPQAAVNTGQRTTPGTANGYTRAAVTPVASKPAVDAAGNTLRVGDTVLVKQPTGKKRIFNLRPNGVAVITRITANGALGFAFDRDNEFLAKRFQKVTLSAAKVVGTHGRATVVNVRSGDLVVTADAGTGNFVLPTNTALTFRGVTVEGGAFILDGYTQHQYKGSRFQKVTPVGTARATTTRRR